MGKPVIMGRKTFESLGKPLPGREIIVVTRDAGYRAEGVDVAASVEAALDLAQAKARASGAAEVVVAGGGEIYAQTMALADKLYITEVDLAPEGDAQFPFILPAVWRETAREAGERGAKDEAGFAFVEYSRLAKP
jgi:dihydrofolate reductase